MVNDYIDILLSTYNGGKYLEQQIDSIFEQKCTHWHLIIRDDGSTDNTRQILSEYTQTYPDKIHLIDDSFGQLGPSASFGQLLYYSDASYVAFCDQDDIWLPDKLLLLLKHIQCVEKRSRKDIPILIHSDLEIVDENLCKLSDSFWKYQNINPYKMQSLERLLTQNCVTGCAMLINRALVKKALPFPEKIIMHDWWCALLASSLGHIECINTQTVKYRQHSCNDTGAKKWNFRFIVTAMFNQRKQYHKSLLKTCGQAQALLNTGELNKKDTIIVTRYVDFFTYGWFRRRFVLMRMGFFKYGLIRNLAMLLWF